MALIDKASLLMVPSVYEDGTLYNVLPSGNKAPDETGNHNGYDQTRADFTFSRGSNLTATRVNANGLIEKGRENLLLQSNTFSNAVWLKELGASVTSGQIGYDGNSNAWKITTDGTQYARLRQTFSSTSGVKTYSLYAKAGTLNWLALYPGGGTGYAFFDLENGTTGNLGSGTISANIEAIGTDGWYRCEYASNESITDVRVYFTESNGIFTTTAGYIFIQDSQLEYGLSSSAVIRTGATTATAGVLENTPRIDYSSGAGALLLEPQRTNFLPHSEYVEGNPLSNSPTITQNYAISPDGGKNAFRMQDVDANDFERFRYLGTESTLCMSLFVKKTTSAVSTYGGFGLNWSGGTSKNVYAAFDEYNGTIAIIGNDTGNAQVFVEDHDTYWRFALSATDTGNNTNVSANYYACISTNFTSPGLGLKDYTAYGAQLEAASYPSSYVPTYGSAATRGADLMKVTGLDDSTTTGVTAATIFVEMEYTKEVAQDALTAGQTTASYQPPGRAYIYNNATGFADTWGGSAFTLTDGVNFKFIWRLNSLTSGTFFKDGVKSGFDVSGTAWTDFDQIYLRGQAATMKVKQLHVYNEALTDAECVTLTTL